VSNGYYRMGAGGLGLPEGVKYLLIWNGILYLLQHFILAGDYGLLRGLTVGVGNLSAGIPVGDLESHFRTIPTLFGTVPVLFWQKGFIWQVATYMFLHGGLFHILFNMFALWMFGCELERMWGTRKFIGYYFFTGIGAGLLTVLLTPHGYAPTIGASGAVYGILLAYALYFPERRILLYFLIPIPVRIFVVIIGLIALINSLGTSGSGIAHIAHLGGLVFGWAYLRGWGPGNILRRWLWRRRRRGMRVVDFTRDEDDR